MKIGQKILAIGAALAIGSSSVLAMDGRGTVVAIGKAGRSISIKESPGGYDIVVTLQFPKPLDPAFLKQLSVGDTIEYFTEGKDGRVTIQIIEKAL